MGDEVKTFLADVEGLVEANSYESLCLWQEYSRELKKPWVSNNSGYAPTIGHLADMPICISLFKYRVDGHQLLFWHPTSQVVDHRAIDAWFEENLPDLPHTGAMNFSNVLHEIERRKTAPTQKGGE